ncbi:hypothetical protein AB0E01_42315 [Nocardia vinacea]|uniref:hypothetical protein n=1 Tax=Nocardia vinacea TaxID=96468 RepID=UPI00340E20B1
MVCQVDEPNAARHVADDSPSLPPPPILERVSEFFDFMRNGRYGEEVRTRGS